MSQYLLVFALAFIVTAIATPVSIKIAPKIGAMDVPKDDRRMHKKPMPVLGGPAIYLGILVSAFFLIREDSVYHEQFLGIFIAGTLMLIVGIVDDIRDRGLPAKVKLLGQLVCAFILWHYSLRFSGMANFFSSDPEAYIVFPGWLSLIITMLWIVAITNTINLIDGLDGLAAGVVFIACLSIAYVCTIHGRSETKYMIVAMAGACLGFLIYNFNPAKIFMGDSGALLLGLLLASVSMVGDTPTKSVTLFSTILPMIILALPIFDTVFAMIRRILSHRSFMEADKGHLHHRIIAMGFGQRRTVLVIYCICAILGIAGVLWTLQLKLEALALIFIAGTLMFIFLGTRIDINDQIAAREEAAHVNEPMGRIEPVREKVEEIDVS